MSPGGGSDRFPVDDLLLSATDLESGVELLRGRGVTIRRKTPVGGGSINSTVLLSCSDGSELFLKTNGLAESGLFREEARGLRALRSVVGPRVPEPLGLYTSEGEQGIFLEYVPPSPGGRGDFSRLGEQLAVMHREGRAEACGFDRDNHIGATPQSNRWMADWHRFFGERRLRPQIVLARSRGLADTTMSRAVDRLIARLPELLPLPEEGRPSLLHGDLWGGNVIFDRAGEPVLIDPAVYYGHREADLAMTELFGGFGAHFFRAYTAIWPLEPGYEERRDVYNLYHLLNHLNLFGGSYSGSCRAILGRYF